MSQIIDDINHLQKPWEGMGCFPKCWAGRMGSGMIESERNGKLISVFGTKEV